MRPRPGSHFATSNSNSSSISSAGSSSVGQLFGKSVVNDDNAYSNSPKLGQQQLRSINTSPTTSANNYNATTSRRPSTPTTPTTITPNNNSTTTTARRHSSTYINSSIYAHNSEEESIRTSMSTSSSDDDNLSYALFIFRRDLRIYDNRGLNLALSKFNRVLPIFIFTPEQIEPEENQFLNENALKFMLESLIELDLELRKDCWANLYFFYGDNEDVLAQICNAIPVNSVICNLDYGQYARVRDGSIAQFCKKRDIEFIGVDDYLLQPMGTYLKEAGPETALALAEKQQLQKPEPARTTSRSPRPSFTTSSRTRRSSSVRFTPARGDVPYTRFHEFFQASQKLAHEIPVPISLKKNVGNLIKSCHDPESNDIMDLRSFLRASDTSRAGVARYQELLWRYCSTLYSKGTRFESVYRTNTKSSFGVGEKHNDGRIATEITKKSLSLQEVVTKEVSSIIKAASLSTTRNLNRDTNIVALGAYMVGGRANGLKTIKELVNVQAAFAPREVELKSKAVTSGTSSFEREMEVEHRGDRRLLSLRPLSAVGNVSNENPGYARSADNGGSNGQSNGETSPSSGHNSGGNKNNNGGRQNLKGTLPQFNINRGKDDSNNRGKDGKDTTNENSNEIRDLDGNKSVNTTSCLSPYLKFGCVSVREVHDAANNLPNSASNKRAVLYGLYLKEFYAYLTWYCPSLFFLEDKNTCNSSSVNNSSSSIANNNNNSNTTTTTNCKSNLVGEKGNNDASTSKEQTTNSSSYYTKSSESHIYTTAASLWQDELNSIVSSPRVEPSEKDINNIIAEGQSRVVNNSKCVEVNVFEKWCVGETGFPIVDAAMRQLNLTGFMPHRARLIAANFLVKTLGIDWRLGQTYFARKLIDHDWCISDCNWHWIAGTAVFSSLNYTNAACANNFDPCEESHTFDPGALYIRKWLPNLTKISTEHLHFWEDFYQLYGDPRDFGYHVPCVETDLSKQRCVKMHENVKNENSGCVKKDCYSHHQTKWEVRKDYNSSQFSQQQQAALLNKEKKTQSGEEKNTNTSATTNKNNKNSSASQQQRAGIDQSSSRESHDGNNLGEKNLGKISGTTANSNVICDTSNTTLLSSTHDSSNSAHYGDYTSTTTTDKSTNSTKSTSESLNTTTTVENSTSINSNSTTNSKAPRKRKSSLTASHFIESLFRSVGRLFRRRKSGASSASVSPSPSFGQDDSVIPTPSSKNMGTKMEIRSFSSSQGSHQTPFPPK